MATLTGACVVALGAHHSGLMSNSDTLAEKIISAGRVSGDSTWRLPLTEDYANQIVSNFADVANISTRGSGAGTITAVIVPAPDPLVLIFATSAKLLTI